jgi:diacylglycerol kinase family enzyme
MPSRVSVVVNRDAWAVRRGGKDVMLARIVAAFRCRSREADVEAVDSEDLEAAVRRRAQERPERVIVGGGDGSMRTAAQILAGSDTALGVLPLGHYNHFARDLGLPLDVEGATAALLGGRVLRVDLGDLSGRVFVNNSSVGVYVQLVREREHHVRLGRRVLAAIAAAWTTFWTHPLLDVEVESPRGVEAHRTPLVFVGNNQYEVGPRLGQRRRLDGGRLWVCTVRATGRWSLLWTYLRSAVGHPKRDALVDELHDWVRIDLHGHRKWVALDGEAERVSGVLEYRVRPRALGVVVPDDEAAPREERAE